VNSELEVESVGGWIKTAGRNWNRFWFTPADPTVLGFIRIWAGIITLCLHVAYSYDLQELFGKNAWFNLSLASEFRQESPWVAPPLDWKDQPTPPAMPADPEQRALVTNYIQRWGQDPRVTTSQGIANCSIWFHVTDPLAMRVMHASILLIMFLFTIGCCTRITSVLTWLAALSYIQRSQISLFGMDTMMNITLFYLMIGPSGAALSFDRWLALRRSTGKSEPISFRRLLEDRPEPMVSANLAIRLFQVHFCIIYMAAGLSKLMGSSWWNGTALWATVANYEFTPIRFAVYAGPLRWLCQHRWLWEIVMSTGVLYTLALEISFPFLVWRPRYRGFMVAGSVVLHTGIAISMGLIGFGIFMLALVMCFFPPETVHAWLDGLSETLRELNPKRRTEIELSCSE
jgi:hypothetical protein